jgi:hypothetical protein
MRIKSFELPQTPKGLQSRQLPEQRDLGDNTNVSEVPRLNVDRDINYLEIFNFLFFVVLGK